VSVVAFPALIKGNWQLAGGHGAVDESQALADLEAYAEAGITAFDCADIYTGVEELLGELRRRWRARHGADAPPLRVHTKCVPDLDLLPRLQRRDVAAIIDRSLARLGVERLDLVQFHWWDFAVPGFEQAVAWLDELRRAGKIEHVGLTNTDTARMVALLDAGIPLVSNQVQVSLLDRRAVRTMSADARARGVALLAYGTLAGGFLHERWLGAREPQPPFENRSLVKYHLVIEECGGWAAFQDLLRRLAAAAERMQASIGQVAVRWTLEQPGVTSAIVGSRNRAHLAETVRIPTLALDAETLASLDEWTSAHSGPSGEVYALERDRTGRHGAIMRYNLNAAG
jgi:aryl-alcohol dehydrogenase-like predicted oxidoreductase